MNIAKLAFRNARQGSGRGIVITLILVSMLISGVLNLGICLQRTIVQQAVLQTGDVHAKFLNLTRDQVEFLVNRIEMDYAISVIGVDDIGFSPGREAFGIPLQSETPLEKDRQLPIAKGTPPMQMNEAAIMPHTAELIGVKPEVGERFTLLVGNSPTDAESIEFVISAVFEPNTMFGTMGAYNIVVSEAFAEARYSGSDQYGRNAYGRQNNTRQVTVRYRPGIDAYQKTEELAGLAGITDLGDIRLNDVYLEATMQSKTSYWVVGGLAALFMLIGALVIYNIFNMLLIRKVKQLGLLSVIGASRGQIALSAYLEALVYALLALPVGLMLGAAFTYIAGSTAFEGFMPDADLVIAYSPWAFLISIGVTLMTVAISVAMPALRVSRVSPVEAVRFSGADEKARKRRHFAEMNLKRLSKINLWRNKGRTMVTIISLTLSGMLFLMVSNMAATQIDSLPVLVAKSFAGDMLINRGLYGEDELNDGFQSQVAQAPGVTEILPVYTAEFSSEHAYDDPSIDYVVIDETLVGLNREMLTAQLADADAPNVTLDALYEPGNVLVYDYMLSSYEEWLAENGGSQVALISRKYVDDQPVDTYYTLNVVGFIGDDQKRATGNVHGGYIGATEMLFAFAPHTRCSAINIVVDPACYDEAEAALRTLCADKPALTFKTMRDAMQEIRGQMVSMYALLLGIVFVLGLVGVMNLINTLLVGVEQRKAELGILCALGASNEQIRAMLLREGRLISLICLMLSVPLGIVMGYLMYSLQRPLSGSYLTYSFPLWQSVGLIAVLLAIPALISLRAAKNLAKQSAIELIQGNA